MRKLTLLMMPLLLVGMVVGVYTSCGDIADENEDIGEDKPLTFGANVTCDEVLIAESFPEQYSQECVLKPGCEEDVKLPLEDDIDTKTVKLRNQDDDTELPITVKADGSEVVLSANDCPDESTNIRLSYVGKSPDQPDGEDDNSTIDDETLTCETVIGFSEPPLLQTTCTVKEACSESGYDLKLVKHYDPVDGSVRLSVPDSEVPSITLEYDADSHTARIPSANCGKVDAKFVVSYSGKQKASAGAGSL